MRGQSPPAPEDNRSVAAYVSTNGAGSNPRRESARRLLALAYIMAVAMPPIGFALGIGIGIRFSNLRSKHVPLIIVVSIVASIIWVVIMTSGALNTPTQGY